MMRYPFALPLLMFLLSWISLPVAAETVYINDRFMVGMHEDKNLDSVIMKLLPSGTSLDVIKKDEPMTQVREPGGDIGWVDNQYLVSEEPGRSQLATAENRIAELEQALQNAGQGRTTAGTGRETSESEVVQQLMKENRELQQLLKTERLRVGELQAETAELKNRLSGTVRTEKATTELENLKAVNANLRQQLMTLRNSRIDDDKETLLADINVSSMLGNFDWKKMLVTIVVSLLIGFAIGLYLLDWIQRRRHGGFRI